MCIKLNINRYIQKKIIVFFLYKRSLEKKIQMSKHPLRTSKTLDIPIIITSSINESNDSSNLFGNSTNNRVLESNEHVVQNSKFKLDKALSLDSHCLEYQNSLSSTSSSINTSIASASSSNGSIHRQQYLVPPPVSTALNPYNSNNSMTLTNSDLKANQMN